MENKIRSGILDLIQWHGTEKGVETKLGSFPVSICHWLIRY